LGLAGGSRALGLVDFDPYGSDTMDKPQPTIMPDAVTKNATRLSRDAHKIIAGTIAAVTGCAILLYAYKLWQRRNGGQTALQKVCNAMCFSKYCARNHENGRNTPVLAEDTGSKATSVVSEECIDPANVDALNAVADGVLAVERAGEVGSGGTVQGVGPATAVVRSHRRVKKNQRKLKCKRGQNSRTHKSSRSNVTADATITTYAEDMDISYHPSGRAILRRRRHTDGSTGGDASSLRGLSVLDDAATVTSKDRCSSRLANIGGGTGDGDVDENPKECCQHVATTCVEVSFEDKTTKRRAEHGASRPRHALPDMAAPKLLDFETAAEIITEGELTVVRCVFV
jgi:hypothetical protein